jgi:S-adenosylmethionine:tRNA ribosyltransferase-isomerase
MIAIQDALDFMLPAELEAREPPEARGLERDQVRLLVSSQGGDRITHARFTDLPDFLEPGDLLVANDSATLPAALAARRDNGGTVAVHLSTSVDDGLWVVEPRKVEVEPGEALALPGGGAATLLAPYVGSRRLWVAELALPAPVFEYLRQWGQPITYSYVRGVWPLEMYQTVYAREPGSAEMPSAGRAFSAGILGRLAKRGIGFATLTLHTGVSSLEEPEPPYPERYSIPSSTAAAVQAAQRAGGRIIAVGTTAVRALESAADAAGGVNSRSGWTDLVITPQRGVRVVDGLLTGFNEPRASHLSMLEAIAGRTHLEKAYRAALEGQYLWHEFGDLHLLLP